MTHLPTPRDDLALLVGRMKSAAAPLRETLRELHARYAPAGRGQGGRLHPRAGQGRSRTGSASSVVTADGQVVRRRRQRAAVHDPVDLQAVRLRAGAGGSRPSSTCSRKVGVEPTGEAFNAIVLDEASNRPFNPMVNAGAIATADLIDGKDFPDALSRMLRHVRAAIAAASCTSTTRCFCPSG